MMQPTDKTPTTPDFDPKIQNIYDEVDMRMPQSATFLPYDEINEIAEIYEVDPMQVAEIVQDYVLQREKETYQDLKENIAECLKQHPMEKPTFKDFIDVWFDEDYDQDFQHVTQDQLKKAFIEVQYPADPNQLSLFEGKLITEIYSDKQARLFAAALSYKRGKLKNPTQEVKDLANNMTEKSLSAHLKKYHSKNESKETEISLEDYERLAKKILKN